MNDTNAIRVYVPDNVEDDIHDQIKWYLAARLGGFTAYEGTGGWIPEDTKPRSASQHGCPPESRAERFERMNQESVMVYESVSDTNEPATIAKRCANIVKSKSDEDAVMWEVRPVGVMGMES